MLTDQAEHNGHTLRQRRSWRARRAAKRGLQELSAKLWSSFWLIAIFAVIMAGLVTLGDLSVKLALASFVGFVAAVVLAPRQETDHDEDAGYVPSPVVKRGRSPVTTVVDALPDAGIILNRNGQVLFYNAPAKGLFGIVARRQSHFLDHPCTRIFGCHQCRTEDGRSRLDGICRARACRPAPGGDGGSAHAWGRSRRTCTRLAARLYRRRVHQSDARRLHSQCQPRVADSAGFLAWFHRDAARNGQGRRGGTRTILADHGRAGSRHGRG